MVAGYESKDYVNKGRQTSWLIKIISVSDQRWAKVASCVGDVRLRVSSRTYSTGLKGEAKDRSSGRSRSPQQATLSPPPGTKAQSPFLTVGGVKVLKVRKIL